MQVFTLRIFNRLFPSAVCEFFRLAFLLSGMLALILHFGRNPVLAENLSKTFSAAHRDFFHLYSPQETDFKFQYMYNPENKEDGGPGKYDLNNVYAYLELPLLMSKDSFLRVAIDYEMGMYDFSPVNEAPTSTAKDVLHKAAFGFGMGHFFSDNFFLTAMAKPGLYSDFDNDVEMDDIQLHGQARLVYRINPGTELLIGADSSETFEDVSLFPLVGFRAISEDGQLHLSLTAPIEARVAWYFNPRTQIYGLFSISGARYNADSGPTNIELDIQTHNQKLSTGAIYWIGNNISLGLEGGFFIGNEFKFKALNAGQFSGDMDPSAFLALNFGLSL